MFAMQYGLGLLADAVPIFDDEVPVPISGLTALLSILTCVVAVGGTIAFVFLGSRSEKEQSEEFDRADF